MKRILNSSSPFYALVISVLGLVLMVWPDMSSGIFCWVVGIAGLIYGAFQFLSAWQSSRQGVSGNANMVIGIIAAALGLFFLIFPRKVLSILPLFLGIFLLINGLSKFRITFELRGGGFGYWWVDLLFSLLNVVLGIVLIFDPFGLVRLAVIFFGASLLISGVSDLVMYFWSGNSR